ncbi:hypothetical protein FH972_023824 [Carpinus fangiana]|uniref:Uncharacterized protein n=1 Tax=Carpinus fangiana TaxID=176857 RepID=A0A5N6KWB3_9ROSI|nr:hypothetical protein FH972_023824 [Carpinus fangiana]
MAAATASRYTRSLDDGRARRPRAAAVWRGAAAGGGACLGRYRWRRLGSSGAHTREDPGGAVAKLTSGRGADRQTVCKRRPWATTSDQKQGNRLDDEAPRLASAWARASKQRFDVPEGDGAAGWIDGFGKKSD